MEQTPTQNIQEIFLNTSRKERTKVTIQLLCGSKLTGRIRSFDKYSIILESAKEEHLIFKHASHDIAAAGARFLQLTSKQGSRSTYSASLAR